MQDYSTRLPGAAHWSLLVRRGVNMHVRDLEGGANLGMLFYNPYQLTEKYNAPDTLKCQHTFKLTRGNCLYSDMGRIFCSITEDSFGWHESVCGVSHAEHIKARWGERDYQSQRNDWKQNGYDSFLVELAKYNLDRSAMAMCLNLFSEVSVDETGNLSLKKQAQAGDQVTLRFEMDTLVLVHSCPHPLNSEAEYPRKPLQITLQKAKAVQDDDFCMNFRPENQRGFANNALYHFGMERPQ